MEVTQRLQLELVQEEAYAVFEEIEGQGSQLDQVVAIVEQHLEGPITDILIQDITEQEAQAAQAKIKAFEAAFPRSE
jgi:hypothetical protein